jgi:hypothetical protein
MDMNYLDILAGRAQNTYTGGKYYEELPDTTVPGDTVSGALAPIKTQKGPRLFDYEYVDRSSRRYTKIFGNTVSTDATVTAISTMSPIDFSPNAYVALRDGSLYLIQDVGVDNTERKEAARYLLAPVAREKVLRLTKIADVWGIGGLRQ